jgi:transcriptional regulator with XRE-family HTH domain
MNEQWTALSIVRELQAIPKSEIAKRLGVHPSSVGRTEAGIPALSSEYISTMCKILSINESFLYEKTTYPFSPKSFLKFYVRGLSSRLKPLKWLEFLADYSENLKLLLLLRRKSDNVVAACVEDDKNSVFLISVEIPLSFKTVFEYTRKQPERKVRVAAREFFDSPNILSPHTSFSDIAHYPRNLVESMIEDAFAEFLSDKEKELIKVIRQNSSPIKKMIEYANKTKK